MEQNNGKRKKKNPALRLIALCLVAAVLAVAWGISRRKAAADQLAAQQAALEAAQSSAVTVAAYDPSELSELTWETDGHEPLTFIVVNGAWRWKDDAAFPADQSALSAMGTAVTSITAERRVGDVEGGLAACGLENPACTVTVSYGGDRHVYQCGDYNGTYRAYYLLADGEIFLTQVNLASYFTKELPDLLQRDTVPSADWVSRDLVTSVVIRDGGAETTVTDADEIDAYLTSLSSVYLKDYADYSADEAEKASFGLDGSRSVTVNYRKSVAASDANGNTVTNYLDTSYVFYIGDPWEDGTYTAVSPASSSVVYLITTEKADGLLGR